MDRIVKRLKKLTSALEEGKKEFEQVIGTIPDPHIRKSILSLEKQSMEYTQELNQEIKTRGGNLPSVREKIAIPKSGLNKQVRNIGKEVIQICRKIEGSIIKLYGRTLTDPTMNESLRQMIRTQRDGIMRSTLQLKLLSKLLYASR
jgi:hypothetical protein